MISKNKLGKVFSIIALISTLVACSDSSVKAIKKDEKVEMTNIKEKVIEEVKPVSVSHITNDKFNYKLINAYEKNDKILFQNEYTDIEGVLTFRGNHYRTSPSYGVSDIKQKKVDINWEYLTSSSSWGGGAGWTGQPALVKWPSEIKSKMNVSEEFKKKKDAVEVIYASLDGNVYFLDMETGKETREKIRVGNPIKGSVSIDPRGLPLLYVGEGINENGVVGFNIYSLIDGSQLFELSGSDSDAPRSWPAFDSSAIVSADTDSVIVGGENGILYRIKLNSNYDKKNNTISVKPELSKYTYGMGSRLGIENSVAAYANLVYFADNSGKIQCVDINTMKPVWIVDGVDDIDATLTVEVENKVPYIYIGNEVDHQGAVGEAKLKKINGVTGEVIWDKAFKCSSLLGPDPVNGGLLSTPAVGKNKISDKVYFSLSRYNGFNKGLLVALNKKTGDIEWEKELDNYAWSSPTDFYDKDGNGYIIQGDSAGRMFLIDGKTGKTLNHVDLNANIEASPAIFNNSIVVASRNSTIYGIEIK